MSFINLPDYGVINTAYIVSVVDERLILAHGVELHLDNYFGSEKEIEQFKETLLTNKKAGQK